MSSLIRRLQFKTLQTNNVGPFVLTLDKVPSSGCHLVLAYAHYGSRSVTSIVQTGVTWAKLTNKVQSHATPANGTNTEIWLGTVAAGASVSMTISVDNFTSGGVIVAEYAGLVTSPPLDKTASAGGTASPASSGTTAATAQADELFIAVLGTNDDTSTFGGPSNGYSLVATQVGNSGLDPQEHRTSMYEKIVSATGATSTDATIASGTLFTWAGAVVTLKGVVSQAYAPKPFFDPVDSLNPVEGLQIGLVSDPAVTNKILLMSANSFAISGGYSGPSYTFGGPASAASTPKKLGLKKGDRIKLKGSVGNEPNHGKIFTFNDPTVPSVLESFSLPDANAYEFTLLRRDL